MKAEGYNAVTIYFDWAYHSPKPGVYDFSGVRDVDKLLDMAAQDRPLRHRAAGPVHQRRDQRGRAPGLADHAGGQGPHQRARL